MKNIFLIAMVIMLIGCTTIQPKATYVDNQNTTETGDMLTETEHTVLENLSFWIGIAMSAIAWYYYDLITDLAE